MRDIDRSLNIRYNIIDFHLICFYLFGTEKVDELWEMIKCVDGVLSKAILAYVVSLACRFSSDRLTFVNGNRQVSGAVLRSMN